MLRAFTQAGDALRSLRPDEPLKDALWIDLCRPTDDETAAVEATGHPVPSLADMEEIEISNRLYREDNREVMTIFVPGLDEDGTPSHGPVTFILTPGRLVTVRHHRPRPFETFPERAGRSSSGVGSAPRLFIGLIEEIVARLADLTEESGRALDAVAPQVFAGDAGTSPQDLRPVLVTLGRQGELLGRVRQGLLTVSRALGFYGQTLGDSAEDAVIKRAVETSRGDIEALGEHGDFLAGRIGMIEDATLGLISLEQNATVRIVSVVAVLFLPPTLVASIYGMNFRLMPELGFVWGYPAALVLMVLSAALTYLVFKWKHWL